MLLMQQERKFQSRSPLLGLDGLDATAGYQLPGIDKAIPFMYFQMPGSVGDLLPNNVLYGMRNEQSELNRLRLQRECLSLGLATLLDFATEPLNIVRT